MYKIKDVLEHRITYAVAGDDMAANFDEYWFMRLPWIKHPKRERGNPIRQKGESRSRWTNPLAPHPLPKVSACSTNGGSKALQTGRMDVVVPDVCDWKVRDTVYLWLVEERSQLADESVSFPG